MSENTRAGAPSLLTENKSLSGDEDKTLLPAATPAVETPEDAPADEVEVEFLYHHKSYQPGDKATLPANDADRLVRGYAAKRV